MSPKKFADLALSTKFLGLESVLAIAACLVVHGHHVLDGHAVRVGQVGDLAVCETHCGRNLVECSVHCVIGGTPSEPHVGDVR